MSRRIKMEKQRNDLENSSSPATYQCIVCQMTTISLSRLHRHQTYQHTPEELSLSTIGLQCSFINNVHAARSIVYDNSWLCDPLKQAEFYTVSANLLNDSNNNCNNCVPVDYAIDKESRIFEREDDVEIDDEQEKCNFDSRIDHNYGRVASSPENQTRIKRFRSVGTETNFNEFPEEVQKSEVSLDLCTEAERIITYFEEVMQVDEIVTIDNEPNYDFKSTGNVTQARQFKNGNSETNGDFESPGNGIQTKESKNFHGVAEEEMKIDESKDSDSKEKSIIKKETEAQEPKVIGSEGKEKNTKVEEADAFVNCVVRLCDDLEKMKKKSPKRNRAPPRNPAPRKAKAAIKPKAPRKKAKTFHSVPENNAIIEKVDRQTEIPEKNENSIKPTKKKVTFADSVTINDTIKENVERETQNFVKNYSPITNFVEINLEMQKTENSILPRKKVKISNSVPENTIIMEDANKKIEIPAKNDFPGLNHSEICLETEKTENSVELPRKKTKISNSLPENTRIMEDDNKKFEIPAKNDFLSLNHSEISLETEKTDDSVDLPIKKAKTSPSENTKIIQENHQEIGNITSTNNTQLNFKSQKIVNSVKKIFSEEDLVEAQLAALFQQQIETQETEISMINDSPSSHWIDYNLVKMEPQIRDEETDLTNDNFIQNYVDTCKAEIPAEIPVAVKSEDQEFFVDEEIDQKNSEHSEDSVVATLPSTYTFPWYPPDINDYSILVLDPEAHQLVWTEVAIVDEKNKLKSENFTETVVLPELTDADLRNSEICENMTISSGSQTKESGENISRSQTKGNSTRSKKKPRTNFVLRPRKNATKKML